MFDYKKSLADRNNGAAFFNGKTSMKLQEVMEAHPEGVHLTGIHIGNGANGEYVAFTMKEEPDSFAFGGSVILDIIKGWIENNPEGESGVNADFAEVALPVKFVKKANKKGQEYWYMI